MKSNFTAYEFLHNLRKHCLCSEHMPLLVVMGSRGNRYLARVPLLIVHMRNESYIRFRPFASTAHNFTRKQINTSIT